MVIPNYWVSSKKHSLTAVVHERLKWTFADLYLLKNRQLNGYVWMLMAGKSSTSTNQSTCYKHEQPFQFSNISVSIWVTLIAGIRTGNAIPSVQMDKAWLTGQLRATLYICTILSILLASFLIVDTLVLTLTWLLQVLVIKDDLWIEVFLRSLLSHNTNLSRSRPLNL